MSALKNQYYFVVVGLQPWDTPIGSNCIDIAKEIAKKYQVLYVNRSLDRRTVLNRWLRSPLMSLKQIKSSTYRLDNVQENIWVLNTGIVLESINQLKGDVFHLLLRYNTRRLAKKIKVAINTLEFEDIILFNDNDFFQSFYLKEELAPHRFIYYLRDFLINQPYFRRNGKSMESAIIKKADLVFTNSVYLKQYAHQYNPHTYYVGQGISVSENALGIELDRPEELNEVSCPVIGYVGNLVTMRLDIEVLEYVTKKRADLFWVFVGPMDNQFANSSMHKLKNVCFTGLKKQNVLSGYVMHFDVCLNPQLLNELTIGNYPRKLDEYLSFGKPVLARKTEATSEFSKYIYEYTNINEFLILLDEALNEETNAHIREERKFFAGMHTWENTVQKILMELDNTNN